MATMQYDVKSQHMNVSGLAIPFRTRLKGFLLTVDTGASGQFGFYDNTYQTATYSRTLTTVTVTLANHGLYVGQWVYLNFTSGGVADDFYQVATANTNTFTVTTAASGSATGGVDVYNNVLAMADVKGSGQTYILAPGEGVLARYGINAVMPANVSTTIFYG